MIYFYIPAMDGGRVWLHYDVSSWKMMKVLVAFYIL